MQKIISKVLDNKMRVLLLPFKDNNIVAVGVFVKTGSAYETDKSSGMAHFLEHMMFQGTKNHTAKQMSETLDSVGALYNAATSYEYTYYYINGYKQDLDLFLDTIMDIYKYPLFKQHDILRERNVIIEELNMDLDNPTTRLYNLFHEKMFPKSSLARPIIGAKENIMAFKRQDFLDFRQKYYVPDNTILVVAGSFPVNKVFNKIQKKMADFKPESVLSTRPFVCFCQQQTSVYLQAEPLAQTQVLFAFRSYPRKDKNNRVLDLVSDLLASGSSSRLFDTLRNRLGVTYFSNAFNSTYKETGNFIIHVGVDNKRVMEVITVIANELKKLKKYGPTEKEMKKIKKIRKASFLLGLQDPRDYFQFYGMQQLLYNELTSPEEIINTYQHITILKMKEVIKDIFQSQHLSLFVYGAIEGINEKKLRGVLQI
jgi:predicted Zn-dependent peptidase